ncbi:unnamed protein product [Pleuronectes platessa]|uniref:Uncharacterized protein n=1 Tax=Pleuronectes platessa TaxID=8262 RepID=A0A9N7TS10_PLEPL|nr:unnamed protein product [Pleuronectes platessa]
MEEDDKSRDTEEEKGKMVEDKDRVTEAPWGHNGRSGPERQCEHRERNGGVREQEGEGERRQRRRTMANNWKKHVDATKVAPQEAFCLSPLEAQCAAPGGPHPVAPDGVAGAGAFFLLDHGAVSIAGAECGPLEGTGYAVSGGHSGRVSGPSRGSPQLRRPLGEPSDWRLAAD